jgi:hypothetical protein
MALHDTQAQIQTILAKTVSACKPQEIYQICDALNRIQHVESPDSNASIEATLGTTFGSTNPNP